LGGSGSGKGGQDLERGQNVLSGRTRQVAIKPGKKALEPKKNGQEKGRGGKLGMTQKQNLGTIKWGRKRPGDGSAKSKNAIKRASNGERGPQRGLVQPGPGGKKTTNPTQGKAPEKEGITKK